MMVRLLVHPHVMIVIMSVVYRVSIEAIKELGFIPFWDIRLPHLKYFLII